MGKSTFINAVRGLTNDHPNAARADIIECTGTMKMYTFQNGELGKVRLYDIQGSGTMDHTAESYFE
jgi:hypothetical protein